MELRHLRYFVAVAEALNFTKAATRLRLAQPALSRQVSDLEDELGVDLLKRTSHGVLLTAEGKLFLEEARAILKRADESVTKVRALARGEFGELQVGFVAPLDLHILPCALAEFQKTTPGVRVALRASERVVAEYLRSTCGVILSYGVLDNPAQAPDSIGVREF